MSATRQAASAGPGWTLGIDFGTTGTVAVLVAPDGELLPLLSPDEPSSASAVVVTATGRVVAAGAASAGPEPARGRLVTRVKAGIGHDDLRAGAVRVPVLEATAALLRHVRTMAVLRAGTEPAAVAIGCPPSWDQRRRATLRRSAELAGWPDAVLAPEPVCVAEYLAASGVPLSGGRTVAILDFGAAHVDVSLVRHDVTLAVIGRTGSALGGRDLDAALRNLVADRRPDAPRIGMDDARAGRESLSVEDTVRIPLGTTGDGVVVTRREFEEAVTGDLVRAAELAAELIDRTPVDPGTFAGLYVTGGVCRMPLMTRLDRAFRQVPVVVDRPLLAVAAGAALHARPVPAPAPDLSGLPGPGSSPRMSAAGQPAGDRRRASARIGSRSRGGGRQHIKSAVTGTLVLGVLGVLVTAGIAALGRSEHPAPAPVAVPAAPLRPPALPSTTPARPAATTRLTQVVETTPPSPRATTVRSRPPATTAPVRPPFRVPAVFALVSASGLCATPDEPRDQDAIAVRLRPCTNDAAQGWRGSALGGGEYVLTNAGTGKCLDLNTAPDTDGGLVQQWLCRDNDHQKWRIAEATGGAATLSVRITGECLAVPPGQDVAAGPVHKDRCAPSSSAQRWRLLSRTG